MDAIVVAASGGRRELLRLECRTALEISLITR
jgi:hypothetical protein